MFTTAKEVFSWMEQNCSKGIQPGLERMQFVLERLNHPERRLKFVHIAGTNGKGSTAAMIYSVLREAEYPTGIFLSPWVTSWNERIQFDGEPISEESFVKWANHILPVLNEMKQAGLVLPTQFEFWTLIAICFFAYEAIPWFVIWETGLGGRLDSTNVVYPLVSVITQIGLDHQEFLGNSIQAIAEEKAGIIKPGVPVICGVEDQDALQVIERTAKEKRARLYQLNRDFFVELVRKSETDQTFNFRNVYRSLNRLTIPLLGEHQLRNAAVAIMTLEILRQQYATVIEDLHFEKGLSKTVWPGRLELISHNPKILLDGAHNSSGIQALVSALQQYYTYNRLFLLVAMMKDKDVKALEPLLAVADTVATTAVQDQPRSLTGDQLAERIKQRFPLKEPVSFERAEEAISALVDQASSDDLILVTGSLYLVAEVRSLLTNRSEK
jgi:dihydrofolate synthase/folylpolyglutamate synthase